MIIRIMGEGQFSVPDADVDGLQRYDERLEAALDGDEATFREALSVLLDRVREVGTCLPDEELDASDAILPPSDATVAEVRALLLEDGVIPGY
ncbi:MAG: PspA-associated protein PspAA [Solirubrobacteraceae bacterium]